LTFILSLGLVSAFKWNTEHEDSTAHDVAAVCPDARMPLEDQSYYHGLLKRQTGGDSVSGGVSVGNVSASTGPISAGIGNINITVGNVTVEAGDINIENIVIGDITVLVSVALSAQGSPTGTIVGTAIPSTSIASSTATGSTISNSGTAITITPTPAPTASVAGAKRQDTAISVPAVSLPSVSLPSVTASATAGVGDVGVNVGSVAASVGNITLTVGNILVKLGSITIKNVTIGNILVAVQLGQPSNSNVSLIQGLLGS